MGRKSKHQKWREAIGKKMTKLTPEVVTKLKEAFAIGATISQACYYAEIAESTYYDWVKKNEVLSEEFATMRSKLPLAAKHNIAQAIHNRDLGLSRWMLERKEVDEYGERLKIEHSGNIDSGGVHSEDKEAVEAYLKAIEENAKKRNLEKAKQK